MTAPAPMTPQRLAEIREWIERDPTSLGAELLAEVDRQAAELARCGDGILELLVARGNLEAEIRRLRANGTPNLPLGQVAPEALRCAACGCLRLRAVGVDCACPARRMADRLGWILSYVRERRPADVAEAERAVAAAIPAEGEACNACGRPLDWPALAGATCTTEHAVPA